MNFVTKQYSEEELTRFIENEIYCEDDMNHLSRYQYLSEGFIRKFQNQLNWSYLRHNELIVVSDSFCEEFEQKLRFGFGFNSYRINGRYHRTKGPAYYDVYRTEYWYRGEYLKSINSMEQYQRWLNMRLFR